jgi:hypothetical protein
MLRRTPRQRSPRAFSVTPPILLPPSFRVVLVPSTPDARVDRGTWRAACREKEMQLGCRRCLCRRQDQSSRIPTGPKTCRFPCATARRRPTARASPWPNRRLPVRSQCPSKAVDVSFLTPSGMSSLLKKTFVSLLTRPGRSSRALNGLLRWSTSTTPPTELDRSRKRDDTAMRTIGRGRHAFSRCATGVSVMPKRRAPSRQPLAVATACHLAWRFAMGTLEK